ncbi:MAG TPA: hypothetical protein VKY31_06060 [Terriglobia bacterium]|nr:hypothetical protein [Terriglobia bacterium]
MNPVAVYEGFIGFEERSANLYLELSVRFADDPGLRWFWIEMAMEEKQHAGLLQHCREAGVFAGELPDDEQVEKLNQIYTRLEQRVESPELTLDEAFDVAIRLESSEINTVYSKLTAPIDGPAHVLRRKVQLSIENHFEKLHDAACRFGACTEIRSRLARLVASNRTPHERL